MSLSEKDLTRLENVADPNQPIPAGVTQLQYAVRELLSEVRELRRKLRKAKSACRPVSCC